MALMNVKPTKFPLKPTETPETSLIKREEVFKTVVSNSAVTSPDSLIVSMEGMPWSVDYYAQVVNRDDVVKELDVGNSSVYTQYRLTKQLELRVQSALSSSYNADEDTFKVNGNAVLPYIVPNVNDYFVTEAGQKGCRVFRVTARERKTYQTKSIWYIEYVIEPAEQTEILIEGFKQRLVQTQVFVKERAMLGMDPLLAPKDYGETLDLRRELRFILRDYFAHFNNRRLNALIYPARATIYDTRLVDYLVSIIDQNDCPDIADFKIVSADHDPNLRHPSIYSVLQSRNIDDLDFTHQKAGLFERERMNRNSFLRSTVCWSIDYYVYPRLGEGDGYANEMPQFPSGFTTSGQGPCGCGSYPGNLFDPVYPNDWSNNPPDLLPLEGAATLEDAVLNPWNTYTLGTGDVIPIVKSVLVDDYYVLSEAFYKQQDDLSLLELLVRDYVKRVPLDLTHVGVAVSCYKRLPLLERFYYGPLLVLLIKDAVRGFY